MRPILYKIKNHTIQSALILTLLSVLLCVGSFLLISVAPWKGMTRSGLIGYVVFLFPLLSTNKQSDFNSMRLCAEIFRMASYPFLKMSFTYVISLLTTPVPRFLFHVSYSIKKAVSPVEIVIGLMHPTFSAKSSPVRKPIWLSMRNIHERAR